MAELRTIPFSYSGDTDKFKFDAFPRCYICNRVIKNPNTAATIHVVDGGGIALHPGDEDKYIPDAGDCGAFDVGPECAKKLGEFVTKAAPR